MLSIIINQPSFTMTFPKKSSCGSSRLWPHSSMPWVEYPCNDVRNCWTWRSPGMDTADFQGESYRKSREIVVIYGNLLEAYRTYSFLMFFEHVSFFLEWTISRNEHCASMFFLFSGTLLWIGFWRATKMVCLLSLSGISWDIDET